MNCYRCNTWPCECRDGCTIIHGDCREVLPELEAGSVASVLTDPPYALTADKRGGTGEASLNLKSPAGRSRITTGGGFMGKQWDAAIPGPEIWEIITTVAIPGAMLLAFGGTRTSHRLACAIEDAGWEIRDTLMWIYGSGFPKSLDISKAIDRSDERDVGWFRAWLKEWRKKEGISHRELCERCRFYGTVNRGGTIANWELGLGHPTIEQFNKICNVLKLPFDSIEAVKRKVIGTKRVIPGVAFSSEGPSEIDITAPTTELAKLWHGYGTALKPAYESITLAMKPLDGTFAHNAEAHGVAGLWIDGARVGTEQIKTKGRTDARHQKSNSLGSNWSGDIDTSPRNGRFPANVIHDGSEEVLEGFSGARSSHGGGTRSNGESVFGMGADGGRSEQYHDSGSAARFFYCAKASKAERNGSKHPTVKPLALMQYLARLTRTPTGGLVLDPFMGSGTTLVACRRERRPCIGIELSEEYCEDAAKRLEKEPSETQLMLAEEMKA